MFKKICYLFVFLSVISLNSAYAHYASVTVDNYTPKIGEEVTIFIGWGHRFPGDGQMRRAAYDHTSLKYMDPDGNVTNIEIVPEEEKGNQPIKMVFKKAGMHTILLIQKNFATKTTKGYKYQPRNKLKNVLHSKWSETVSKAVVDVANSDEEISDQGTTDRFQITLLANPLKIDKGDFLPVKVTMDGKPWKGMVFATYSAFSDSADTFAYTTRTDKMGVAKIKMLENGLWLIKADYSYPYENKDEADDYSLKSTVTFRN